MEQEAVGRLCKRLIDYGRLLRLQAEGGYRFRYSAATSIFIHLHFNAFYPAVLLFPHVFHFGCFATRLPSPLGVLH